MLQNEPQTEQATPVGQKRITPEELSQAVAAIERRREAEAKCIAIDEAVSQLHLDATSEDIWREVQAQRESAEAERQKAAQVEAEQARLRAQQAQSSSPQTRVPAAAFARGRRRRWPRVFLPLIIFGGIFHWTGLTSHHSHTARSAPPALTATAAQIPDGTQFFCDITGLLQICLGDPLSQIHISTAQTFSNSWKLVKERKHVYLRAYTDTVPLASGPEITRQSVLLFNDGYKKIMHGESTAPITVRVDKVRIGLVGGDDGHNEVLLQNFQPDQLTTTSKWK